MFIIIGADIVPTDSNNEQFCSGEVERILSLKIINLLQMSSYSIFNLETPLIDEKYPIMKCGPNLQSPNSTINGIKKIGIDLLTLANNHIMDQGIKGLESTIDVLDKADIRHVGVGVNLSEASTPYIFSFAGKNIGVYACAEHEFSIATETTPGANPFDPLWSLDHIEDLKKKSDFVIVLYHGGKEHYRYPSPNLQKICRRLVDKGADLVICQHSHCIGCEEKYKDGTIVYGQGNFLFDHSNDECWKTSVLIKIEEDMSISYIPLVKVGNGVDMADEEKGKEIIDGFLKRSEEIKQPGFLNNRYKTYADEMLDRYLMALSGKRNLITRTIDKLTNGLATKRHIKMAYKQRNRVVIANYIDCEAHRELLSQALSKSYSNSQ